MKSANFTGGKWCKTIDVADFIQKNYSPYEGNGDFLVTATPRTKRVLEHFENLLQQERDKGGVLDIDTQNVSSLLSYNKGVLHADELIVGLQTDAPLKRGVNPFGGIKMAKEACEAYGYTLSNQILQHFAYKTTHNDGVFRVYTPQMKKLRKAGIITGLPDAYGRGRIIGDYRRVALYGVDRLVQAKQDDNDKLANQLMTEENIRLREEIYRQIDFLHKLQQLANMYGYDISKPATTAHQAIQFTYFAYLGAIKEQNGAAMSLGRVSTFFDIFIDRDIALGILTENTAQELIDDFCIKLRAVRQLRTPEYNELFAGDPNWVTESIGGMGRDGRTLVTKTSFRFLNTLYNLGASPEPNLTVLFSKDLPQTFKEFAAKVSIDTSSVQYENDDIMRPLYGDDYGISCCVSAMTIGKQMQYFGARCNLAKTLLLAINGGRDELSGDTIVDLGDAPLAGKLEYDVVLKRFKKYIKWLCNAYVNTMNVIHFMHDKYAYEKLQMALHDTHLDRLMAFGIAGISVVADSLSAIKHAYVTALPDSTGLIKHYKTDGDFAKFGNDDDSVDNIARDIVKYFYSELTKTPAYRNARHTLSLLTITSNVVYGKKTGDTPCGRKAGEAFAPGANPQHTREISGALASLNSVCKLPYECCKDGISNTWQIVPSTLGQDVKIQSSNLADIIGGYFNNKGHHLNVNSFTREQLLDAHEHPEKYPNLTIRVSGYAVKFTQLSKAHREEVLSRTFFDAL